MKQELKTPILIVLAVVAVAFAVWIGMRTIGGAGNLDQGQIKYTPGKPPWEETDPNKQGPGGAPGMGQTAPGGTPPANAPQGMGAPQLGNTGK